MSVGLATPPLPPLCVVPQIDVLLFHRNATPSTELPALRGVPQHQTLSSVVLVTRTFVNANGTAAPQFAMHTGVFFRRSSDP